MVLFLCAIGLAASAFAGELSINLTVTERAGVARIAEPVSNGVPFPQGALQDEGLAGLALFDEKGQPVPAQFKVLERWWRQDKSVRWLLVSFAADAPADGKAVYTLKTGQKPAEIANPLVADVVKSDDPAAVDRFYEGHLELLPRGPGADKVTITTGPLRFTVKRKGFNLFDEAWIDESGKGEFSDANRLVSPHDRGLVWFSNFKGLEKNKYYSAGRFEAGTLEVLEAGPVRAVLKLTGKFAAADAEGGPQEKLEYEVFIHAWRGSSIVKVTCVHRLREGALDEGLPIDGMYAELPLALGTEKSYSLGKTYGGGAVSGALKEGNAWVLADGSDHHVYGGTAKEAGEGKCKTLQPAGKDIENPNLADTKTLLEVTASAVQPRELGWADLSDGAKGLTVGCRRFWQQWPKAAEARAEGGGAVRLHLWANLDEAVHKVPADYDQKMEAMCSDTVPGRSSIFPGTSKTHELVFYFHGKPDAERMRAAFHAVETPAWALCDREWYCEKTQGFGKLASSNPELYAYDPRVAEAMKALDAAVKENIDFIGAYRGKAYPSEKTGRTYDMYGCYSFGNFVNFVNDRGRHRAIDILWDNNYYDYSVVPFAQFARTGDIGMLEHAIECDNNTFDICMMCWHPDRQMWGCGRGCPEQDQIRSGHVSASQPRLVYAAAVASWHKTNFFRWQLFGDYRTFEGSYLAASYPGLNPDKIMRSSGHAARSWGMALRNASIGYLSTGDKRFLDGGRKLMQHPITGGQDYMKGIAYEGLVWWYEASGEKRAADMIKEKNPRGQGTKTLAGAFLFGLDGDRARLDYVRDFFAGYGKQIKKSWGSVQDAGLNLRNGLYATWYIADPEKVPNRLPAAEEAGGEGEKKAEEEQQQSEE
jgi:hypothetical protein